MMRDEDKPFVCYKQGWSMKIVPRGTAGWCALALWMTGLGAMLAAFVATMSVLNTDKARIGATAVFLAASVVWAVAMTRWMLARSEIVDLEALIKLKRQRERTRR